MVSSEVRHALLQLLKNVSFVFCMKTGYLFLFLPIQDNTNI